MFRDNAALIRTTAVADRRLAEGLTFRRLSTAETVELESALAPIASRLAGALHYEADEVGDAYRFCVALAGEARRKGVEFRFGTQVTSLEMRLDEVIALVSDRERFVADRYVVAAGSYSTTLLGYIGFDLPVRPVKGYSVTTEVNRTRPSLNIPVIDDHAHAAIVPLEGAIRVASTAEFARYDRTLNADRIRNLLR